jgi:hypothetical protein
LPGVLKMLTMITSYREDNDDVYFKFIHVKAATFDPSATATLAAVGRPVGNKKAKAMRDAASASEKLHSSILACIVDAAAHAAT